jgi:hypothetical protein
MGVSTNTFRLLYYIGYSKKVNAILLNILTIGVDISTMAMLNLDYQRSTP